MVEEVEFVDFDRRAVPAGQETQQQKGRSRTEKRKMRKKGAAANPFDKKGRRAVLSSD